MVPLIAGLLGLLFFVSVTVYVLIHEYRATNSKNQKYRVTNVEDEVENLTLEEANQFLRINPGYRIEAM